MSELHHGDALDVLSGMRTRAEAVVCDPPSGIAFMGLRFDTDHGGDGKWIGHMAPRFAAMREACIPGAYGLFWALPRTQDWTMQALRRAGWHIVDVLAHFFGQGWPKGRGQLKPAQEAWILCRDPRGKVRPLNIDACRVRRDGGVPKPGGLIRRARHYDGARDDHALVSPPEPHEGGSWPPNLLLSHAPACCRVGARKVKGHIMAESGGTGSIGYGGSAGLAPGVGRSRCYANPEDGTETVPAWECLAVCSCGLASLAPAGGAPTLCSCGEERHWTCPSAILDEQSGMSVSVGGRSGKKAQSAVTVGGFGIYEAGDPGFGDSGGASRFFPQFHYDAKASRAERQAGCEGLLWVRDDDAPIGWRRVAAEEHAAAPEADRREGNVHATIKPVGCGQDDGLMRWLVRLVTPGGGSVLDGMMGSGSTGVAAQLGGRDFIGCDIDPGAVEIARARLAFWTPERHRLALRDATALRAEQARERGKRNGETKRSIFDFVKL